MVNSDFVVHEILESVVRDMNPNNKQNWKLVCSACGADFSMDETIELADGHSQKEHPDLKHSHFNIVWVGIGPKPRGGPHAGSARRGSGKTRRRR